MAGNHLCDVMDPDPMLASLTMQLEARLGFQEQRLVESLQQLAAQAVKAGGRGGRFPVAIAIAYGTEAERRAELVASLLRETRSSCSPKHLYQAREPYRATVTDIFKDDLSKAAQLAEQIAGFRTPAPDPSYQSLLAGFRAWTDGHSRRALAQVEGVIMEIVNAAAQDMAAQDRSERPSYVNNFHAPVANVAQGNASVGSVSQMAGTFTPQELADAVAQLVRVLPDDRAEKAELEAAHEQLGEGKVPLARLCTTFTALKRATDLVTRAPQAIEAVQHLGRLLGM